MKKILLLALTIFIFITTSQAQEKVFGTYRSNIAELGFFGTSIKLKKDYTFEYRLDGDLMHKRGKGIFEIQDKNIILLKFDENIENSWTTQEKLTLIPVKGTKKYLLKNEKLFVIDKNNQVIKKTQALNNKGKMTEQKSYLKKVK